MRKTFKCAALAAMTTFLLASCEGAFSPISDDDNFAEGDFLNPVELTFNAGFESVKLSVSADGKCSWDSGDQIKIYSVASDGTVRSATATVQTSGPKATFTATVEQSDRYYAVYPASAAASLSTEGELSIDIPSLQDGTFASASLCAAVADRESLSLAFKHVTSVLKFSVERTDFTRADVITKGGDNIAGVVKCSFKDGGIEIGAASLGESGVTINGAGTYYLALAPGVSTPAIAIKLSTSDSDEIVPAVNVAATSGLSFQRSKILNIGNVDNYIVYDYYLSSDGTGNGLSSSSPASYSLLSSMASATDKFSNRILAGTTFHLAAGTYNVPSVIALKPVEACPFTVQGEGDVILNGGASTNFFKTEALAQLYLKGLTFKSGKTASGGALYMSGGKIDAQNCSFASNSATTSAGVMYATNASDVSFKNCTFVSNTCSGTSNAPSCIMLWGNAFVKLDGCYFGSNTASNRAVINAQGTSLVFINACAFNNNANSAETTYASVVHAGNNGVCINNSTFYQNNKKNTSNAPQSNCESITANANMIITNSTFYEYFQQNRSVIACVAAKKGIIFNDIILNNYSGSVFYFSSAGYKFTSYGHNIYRTITDYRSPKDGIAAATGDIAGVAADILNGRSWDANAKVYSWDGTLKSGTLVKTAASEFETAVKAMTESVSNTVSGSGKLGELFWNWLTEIDAVGKDQLGNDRGSEWWPGAYQRN